jgi:hypothetical protein
MNARFLSSAAGHTGRLMAQYFAAHPQRSSFTFVAHAVEYIRNLIVEVALFGG